MHTIRLRGPWLVEPLERYVRSATGVYECSTAELPVAAKMTMPADWGPVLGATFLGRVRYLRTFQKPTGLDSGERVWLVVEAPRTRGTVALHGMCLGQVCAGEAARRVDITEILEDHNRLEIIVEQPVLDANGLAGDDFDANAIGGLVGEVRLEIEE